MAFHLPTCMYLSKPGMRGFFLIFQIKDKSHQNSNNNKHQNSTDLYRSLNYASGICWVIYINHPTSLSRYILTGSPWTGTRKHHGSLATCSISHDPSGSLLCVLWGSPYQMHLRERLYIYIWTISPCAYSHSLLPDCVTAWLNFMASFQPKLSKLST